MNSLSCLQRHVEALIFCAAQPVKVEEIRQAIAELYETEIAIQDIEIAIQSLVTAYQDEKYAFQVVFSGAGYQFLTKPIYQESINIFLKQKSKKRLSQSALETIAIIAYKQPITKSQIEDIRGVNSDYAVQKLLEKELIELRGKAETVGKPILYGTTEKFMDYFGINSLKELPLPKDFEQETTNEIGLQS